MTFRKGDRVALEFPEGSLHTRYNGSAGTVQQCRSGGLSAVVKLDSGERVSIYQDNLSGRRDGTLLPILRASLFRAAQRARLARNHPGHMPGGYGA